MARRKEAHGGGHGWFVTFADLMGLLVAFFVMLVAYSTQDAAKLQVVAGSMRDAFGVQDRVRYSGIIEVPGLPTRPKLKNTAHISPEEASATPTPNERDRNRTYGARFHEDQRFALASASLRQALQDLPEITEASKHIMIEVRRRQQDAERTHPQDHPEDGTGAQGDAIPALHHWSYLVEQHPSASRLRPVGTVGRPRQCGARNSGGRGPAAGQYVHGGRQGRHRTAVPGQSRIVAQPPRHHYPDAGRASGAG
jgi:flagellar motor protein MotB